MTRLALILSAALGVVLSLGSLHAAVPGDAVSAAGIQANLEAFPGPVDYQAPVELPDEILALTYDGELFLLVKKPRLENFGGASDSHQGKIGPPSLNDTWENHYDAHLIASGLCHWLSEDPMGYMDGLNLYAAYMGLEGRDPTGAGIFSEAWTALWHPIQVGGAALDGAIYGNVLAQASYDYYKWKSGIREGYRTRELNDMVGKHTGKLHYHDFLQQNGATLTAGNMEQQRNISDFVSVTAERTISLEMELATLGLTRGIDGNFSPQRSQEYAGYMDAVVYPFRGKSKYKQGNLLGGATLQRRHTENMKNALAEHGITIVAGKRGDAVLHARSKELGKYVAGGFEPDSKTIYLRSDTTKLVGFHEFQHALDFVKRGGTAEAYYSVPLWKRELHVYQQILANRRLFNDAELDASRDLINRHLKDAKKEPLPDWRK